MMNQHQECGFNGAEAISMSDNLKTVIVHSKVEPCDEVQIEYKFPRTFSNLDKSAIPFLRLHKSLNEQRNSDYCGTISGA